MRMWACQLLHKSSVEITLKTVRGHEVHCLFYLEYEQSSQVYNIEFVEPPPYDCQCRVCLEIFKDKVCFQTKCCGHHICSECTTRLKNMKTTCEVCRSGSFDVNEDQFFTREILNLKVRCYYSNAGCKWTGELRQLDEHKKNAQKNQSSVNTVIRIITAAILPSTY